MKSFRPSAPAALLGLAQSVLERSGALYGHLTRDGAFVALGDTVAQGLLLGGSGNTGNTADRVE